MFTNLFGNYLVKRGVIDAKQLAKIKSAQEKIRVRLGLIAVTEKLMTLEQADAVNEKQAMLDRRFGDIAVEMGFLTRDQVKRLLSLQGSPYITFTQTVTDLGYMTLSEIEEKLSDYQKEKGYTSMDMDAIKSGDIDRIMPLLLPEELPWNTAEHAATAVRTISRIACSDVYVKSARIENEYTANGYAAQNLYGDFNATTAVSGDKDGLLLLAGGFAKEAFKTLDEEALDSIAELVNIIDGLFATAISHDLIEVSLMPPEMSTDEKVFKADKMCIISMEIEGRPVDFIISIGSLIEITK